MGRCGPETAKATTRGWQLPRIPHSIEHQRKAAHRGIGPEADELVVEARGEGDERVRAGGEGGERDRVADGGHAHGRRRGLLGRIPELRASAARGEGQSLALWREVGARGRRKVYAEKVSTG